MARRVFVSYQHEDQLKAKGFDLMRYNDAPGLEFVTRGLLDPVKSHNPDYIRRCIREQMKGTSVTVVLIGSETADSDWVRREIAMSGDKDPPNGLVGIRLSPGGQRPEGMEGAEILDWSQPDDVREFGAAIDRAAKTVRLMEKAREHVGTGSRCGR